MPSSSTMVNASPPSLFALSNLSLGMWGPGKTHGKLNKWLLTLPSKQLFVLLVQRQAKRITGVSERMNFM